MRSQHGVKCYVGTSEGLDRGADGPGADQAGVARAKMMTRKVRVMVPPAGSPRPGPASPATGRPRGEGQAGVNGCVPMGVPRGVCHGLGGMVTQTGAISEQLGDLAAGLVDRELPPPAEVAGRVHAPLEQMEEQTFQLALDGATVDALAAYTFNLTSS